MDLYNDFPILNREKATNPAAQKVYDFISAKKPEEPGNQEAWPGFLYECSQILGTVQTLPEFGQLSPELQSEIKENQEVLKKQANSFSNSLQKAQGFNSWSNNNNSVGGRRRKNRKTKHRKTKRRSTKRHRRR